MDRNDNFGYAIVSSLAMSVISVAGVVLLAFEKFKLTQSFLIIAASVLFSDALFHITESLIYEKVDKVRLLTLVGGGMGLTVSIHKLTHAHPHKGAGYANLANEIIHNFIDGLALGVSWMSGYHTGMSAFIAIAAHELPQEVGDFAILLSAMFPVRKLLALNFLVSLTCPLGVLVSYYIGATASMGYRESLLPVTAGSFMASSYYILAPLFTKTRGRKQKMKVIMIASVALALSGALFAYSHDHGNHHSDHHHHEGHNH